MDREAVKQVKQRIQELQAEQEERLRQALGDDLYK
jgi:uncharacterized membrane protein (DUF106 family)